MKLSVDILIDQPKSRVWTAITDIENAANMISSIIDLSVIEQPKTGLIGLKWQETRLMFGKQATETMWITDAQENDFYCTRAESHGAVYLSKLSLQASGDKTLLTMSFEAQAQSFIVKVISACMSIFIKGSMTKALKQDLEDIKAFVEQP